MTFCVVFNTYYDNDYNSNHCQILENNKNDFNNPANYNAQYVASGTFGIVSDEFIDSFQLFVIDTLTSNSFLSLFTSNMMDKFKSVGFDDIFQGIAIMVEPFD